MAVNERRVRAVPVLGGPAAARGLPLPWRVSLLLVLYTALSWTFTAEGLDGDDTLGLVAFILAISGLFVLVQVTWLRGLLRPMSLVLANVAVPVVCGGVWGRIARGEAAVGLTAGLVIGLAAVLAAFWLGDLVQLRRTPRVFISYRHGDSGEFVAALGPLLVERYGAHNVFVDTTSIALGEDFRTELATALRRADLVLAVVGPGWLDARADDGGRRLDDPDDYVRLEIETALDIGLPVVPLLVGGAVRPPRDMLPTSLQRLSYLQTRSLTTGPEEITNEVCELARRLEDRFRVHVRTSFRTAPRRRLRWRLGVALVAVTVVAQPALLGLQEATADYRQLPNAVLAPDGGLVATGGTTIRLWNPRTGELVRESRLVTPIGMLSWSPDSRWLAAGGYSGNLAIWDRDTLTVAQDLFGNTEGMSALAWSADSARVAVGDSEGTVSVWNRADGHVVTTSQVAVVGIEQLAWAPRHPDLIVAVDSLGQVIVTRFGEPHPQPVSGIEARKIAWSPSGEHLAVLPVGLGHLVLLDDTGTVISSVDGATGGVEDMAWSPDGHKLAAVTEGFGVKLWVRRTTAPAHPRPPFVLDKGAASGIPVVTWSQDGTTVIGSTGDVIRAWRLADNTLVADIPRSTDGDRATLLGWMSNPTRLVEAQPEVILAWDIEAGTEDTAVEVPMVTAVGQWLGTAWSASRNAAPRLTAPSAPDRLL